MSAFNGLVKQCREVFGQNLRCILVLGSVQRGDTTPFSDLDLVIIIGTMNVAQVSELRSIVRSLEILIDCSILCQDEIPDDPEKFRVGTHGCYQLELILKHADCVYGTNVLLKLPQPREEMIRKSVLEKIAEYTWWTRRLFVESNRERSLEMNYKLNSRLIKLLRDLLYLKNGTGLKDSAESVAAAFIAEYASLLTDEERDVLIGIVNNSKISTNASNMSDGYLLIRYSIVNKIYKEALILVP